MNGSALDISVGTSSVLGSFAALPKTPMLKEMWLLRSRSSFLEHVL